MGEITREEAREAVKRMSRVAEKRVREPQGKARRISRHERTAEEPLEMRRKSEKGRPLSRRSVGAFNIPR